MFLFLDKSYFILMLTSFISDLWGLHWALSTDQPGLCFQVELWTSILLELEWRACWSPWPSPAPPPGRCPPWSSSNSPLKLQWRAWTAWEQHPVVRQVLPGPWWRRMEVSSWWGVEACCCSSGWRELVASLLCPLHTILEFPYLQQLMIQINSWFHF